MFRVGVTRDLLEPDDTCGLGDIGLGPLDGAGIARESLPIPDTDAAEMLDRERPDFLDVATDVPGHAPLVELAASRNAPVICQKPLAATFAECVELVDLCREAGVSTTVHEDRRRQAAPRGVQQPLAERTIGVPFVTL